MSRRMAMLGMVVTSVVALSSEQGTRFRSGVDAVRVDVLVTHEGRPLAGLTASDFLVFDNDVPQRVDLVSVEAIPANVVFALDTSGSLSGPRLTQLREAVVAVLDRLKPDDRAALVTFGHAVNRASALSTDRARLRSSLESTRPFGLTSLIDGSYTALLESESMSGRGLLIIFSDGLDTSSWLTADQVLSAATRSETVVYAVAVDQGRSNPFLRDLAESSGGTVFRVDATSNLSEAFGAILDEFRKRYVIAYRPVGVSADGWHRVVVKVARGGVVVKARAGYQVGS